MIADLLIKFSQSLESPDAFLLVHVQVDVQNILQEHRNIQVLILFNADSSCFESRLRFNDARHSILAVVDDGFAIFRCDLVRLQNV